MYLGYNPMLVALIAPAIAFSTMNDSLPPYYYQGNPSALVVKTVDNTNSPEACGVAPKGWRIQACHVKTDEGVSVITSPNPCRFPEAQNPATYAHLMCHEFGHANGWNSDHNN